MGIGTAKDILAVATQGGIWHTRGCRIDHIRLNHNFLGGQWTIDHIESKYRSIRGHTGAMVISDGNFVAV